MNTRTITTIEHERHSLMKAHPHVSCSVARQSLSRTRGRTMIDIYPIVPIKKVRALQPSRPPTIWDYCGGRHTAPFALRSLALVLIVALNAYALMSVGTTAAYYIDGEVLKGNNYIAGSVDFTLASTPYNPPSVALSLGIGDVATRTVSVIPEQGTNAFWYHASSTNFGADLDFCESLSLTSSLEGVQNYSGLLTDFTSPATTTLTNWQFDISTNNALFNKVCTFDIEYTAWQERHNVPGFTEMGYNDTEKEPNKIASQGIRLNKVYYDVLEGITPSPCGELLLSSTETNSTSPCLSSTTVPPPSPPRGSEILNEWVEVYNQTNVVQNIAGWSICDNTSCDVIPSTAILPPFGYAIITPASSTLALWNIPSSFPQALLSDGAIGDGLDNDNDMLVLKRPDGVIVDQMNYGPSPNIGWANYNTDVWIPGAIDVPEGGVLARSPNGYDTDQPSDWVGFGVPTIMLISPSSSIGGTWEFSAPHDIFWSATNPNGSSADLLVDIYFIKDSDGTRTPTPADTVIPVVSDTENDGHYYMEASSGFSGYFWVKVVVTGSENPLLNDADYSGKFYGSIVCKSSSSLSNASSTSGCISTKNDSNDKDNTRDKDDDNKDNNDGRDDDDKKYNDDKKHHDDEEEHDRIVKDSSEHNDEEVHDDSHETLAKHDDDKGKKEVSDEQVVEEIQTTEEPPSSVTVYKKEEEFAVVVEKSTSQDDTSGANLAFDPAPVVAVEEEVVGELVAVSE